jgi:hypothetical protein
MGTLLLQGKDLPIIMRDYTELNGKENQIQFRTELKHSESG